MKLFYTCIKLLIVIIIPCLISVTPVFSQFSPIPIAGFNHDVVAESGTSALTTTTIALDLVSISNYVMYTQNFRTTNSFGGGGLPDNGLITSGADNYQLASFDANNIVLIQRNQNADVIINSPSRYRKLRVLAFSAEGSSLANATLFFADGSQTTALTNYNLGDWFNNTGNLVISGFGRCKRTTPASGAEAYPANPRMYYIEIPLSCTDMQKDLQKINFSNVTTTGANAPFPNMVIMAVSGIANSLQVNATINNATCNVNGSAVLAVTGPASPYSITWNTTPLQTGTSASNLPAGNFIATITDVNACTSSFPVSIGLNNNLTMTVNPDTSICFGASFSANTTGNATGYSWSPATGVSNTTIANPVLSPASTTSYTITGTLGSCTIVKSFTVNVDQPIVFNVQDDTTICLGASFNANISGNATSYSWSPVTGVSNPALINPVLSPIANTTYTITATTGNCSVSETFTVSVVPGVTVFAGNDINIIEGQTAQLQGNGSQGTYLWTPSAGLNAVNIPNPVTNTLSTITYTLNITSPQGCIGSDDVLVTVVPYCIKAMEAITPNGDGINDRWLITNGNCITNASVHVYNRYGNQVYENKDYKNDWQGTYKGKPLPDATYYFVIEYKLLDRRKVFVKGSLTILR